MRFTCLLWWYILKQEVGNRCIGPLVIFMRILQSVDDIITIALIHNFKDRWFMEAVYVREDKTSCHHFPFLASLFIDECFGDCMLTSVRTRVFIFRKAHKLISLFLILVQLKGKSMTPDSNYLIYCLLE